MILTGLELGIKVESLIISACAFAVAIRKRNRVVAETIFIVSADLTFAKV